jgi:erythromycin esterase-like protein
LKFKDKIKSFDFRYWFWFRTPLRRLALWLRDDYFNKVNEHRWIRLLLFSKRNVPFYDFFDFYMDEHMANRIVKTFATDRALARMFKSEYPYTNVTANCQYDGSWLKRYAAEYLELPSDWEEIRRQTPEYMEWVEKNSEHILESIKGIEQ